MAYCLGPITAWPPLCPQRTPINKSNPVSWQGLRLNSLPTRGWLAGRGSGGERDLEEQEEAWRESYWTFCQWRKKIILLLKLQKNLQKYLKKEKVEGRVSSAQSEGACFAPWSFYLCFY